MLEFHTGFDMIPTSTPTVYLGQLGWTHLYPSVSISTSIVRNGSRSCALSPLDYIGLSGLGNAATRVVGFGLYVTGFNTNIYPVAMVGDGSPLVTGQIGISIDSTGHFVVRRGQLLQGSSGTILATSVNGLTLNTWCFVELVVTVHASAGSVEVYVNGSKTNWIDLSGVNTQSSANAYSNSIGFGSGVTTIYVDDVYTLTGTGASPTTRLGDCKSVIKYAGTDLALGAGTYADSTPSTGTDRGANVDDNPTPDDDTTYNSFTAAAQKDAYKTAALGLTGSVIAATVRARLKKSDAGDGSAQVGVRSGSVDDFSADVFPSDTSYQWFSRQYTTDPNTGAAWTIPNLDAAQILVKRTL